VTITMMIKAVADREDDRRLREIEGSVASAVARALDALRRDIWRGITDDNVHELEQRIARRETWQAVADALYQSLSESVTQGVETGRRQIERDIFGVVKRQTGTAINWELAAERALQWLASYVPELTYAGVYGLQSGTLAAFRREIGRYIADKRTMGQLRESLAREFGEGRANRIAVTEVTRTFMEGNLASWRESGVTDGKQWNTNRDEIVCPICRPLNDTVVALNEPFNAGGLRVDGPPAHPNCRCWVSPVASVPDAN